jgi:16S rRNA A1518/A1519 N6-dimethyltransferase RsmA/KsgA/DIM1 with predicted DNA glycosylase/AP lyase activity
MEKVKPKKHLGQHFLTDLSIAERIAQAVKGHDGVDKVLEIGPGMGVLTDFLLKNPQELYLIEIDRESIAYLHKKYPELGDGAIVHLINTNPESYHEFGLQKDYPDYLEAAGDALNIVDPSRTKIEETEK